MRHNTTASALSIDALIERKNNADSQRQNMIPQWNDVDTYFNMSASSGKAKDFITDATFYKAAQNLISSISAMSCGQQTEWFSIDCERYEGDAEANHWLDVVNENVKRSYMPDMSNFYEVVPAFFTDLVLYGNALFYDDFNLDTRRFVEVVPSIKEVNIEFDMYGDLVGVYRPVIATALQIRNSFQKASLPKNIEEALNNKSTQKFTLWHIVIKNEFYTPDKIFSAQENKPFSSIWIDEHEKVIIDQGGYYAMPFYFVRANRQSGDNYGYGFAQTALPSAKRLNKISTDIIRNIDRAANPTMLAKDDDGLILAGMKPGTILPGGLDAFGREQVKYMHQPNALPEMNALLQNLKRDVEDLFMYRLLRLDNRTGMTATEVMKRDAEEGEQITPFLARIQTDFLAPKTKRRYSLLQRAGLLPNPPASMQGKDIKVRFVSQAQKVQEVREGANILQYFDSILPLANVQPELVDAIDFEAALDLLREKMNVPQKLLKNPEEVQALRQARFQHQQALDNARNSVPVAQAMQQGTQAIKNVQEMNQKEEGAYDTISD